MSKTTLVCIGIILFITGTLLTLLSFVGQGINDGAWRNITDTGAPAISRLKWSPWQPNDGSVYPFSSSHPDLRSGVLSEFRVGSVKGWFFDYVFYQGRFVHNGIIREFPALGPGSGAHYHWEWAWLAFGLGASVFLVAGCVGHRSILARSRPENQAMRGA